MGKFGVIFGLAFGAAFLANSGAQAQPSLAEVVAACGTPNATYSANQDRPITQSTGGNLCTSATATISGTVSENLAQVNGQTVNVGTGAAGTGTQRVTTSTDSTIGTVTSVTTLGTVTNPVGVKGSDGSTISSVSNPVRTAAGQLTIIPLDVATVTTGGTAVNALTAGHRTAGGFLTNPKGATIDLCINEQGAASGTTSAGALTCIAPGQSYTLAPAAGAVSVVTSDSSHPFSGYGLN